MRHKSLSCQSVTIVSCNKASMHPIVKRLSDIVVEFVLADNNIIVDEGSMEYSLIMGLMALSR